jgi:hypothetical protein
VGHRGSVDLTRKVYPTTCTETEVRLINIRIEDSRLRDDVASIRHGITRFSFEQDALSQDVRGLYCENTGRWDGMENNVIAGMHELKDSVEHITMATNNNSKVLAHVYGDVSAIRSNTSKMHRYQGSPQFTVKNLHKNSASQRIMPIAFSTERDTIAENPDLLGRIVRKGLRQQLEPVLHRLKEIEQVVDQIALSVSLEAHKLTHPGKIGLEKINTVPVTSHNPREKDNKKISKLGIKGILSANGSQEARKSSFARRYMPCFHVLY